MNAPRPKNKGQPPQPQIQLPVGRQAVGFGRKLLGADADQVELELRTAAAEQLFAVLGELKGGAMKVGQALSVMEAAIPEQYGKPYREALTKLQREAPPLPAAKVHRMLDAQLGTKWRDRFQSFDDTPVASASIGQVHKAVWSDGREVAVKIQYPGADEALRATSCTVAFISFMAVAASARRWADWAAIWSDCEICDASWLEAVEMMATTSSS